VYLEKFKEKKPAVVTALREAVDAAYLSVSVSLVLGFKYCRTEHL